MKLLASGMPDAMTSKGNDDKAFQELEEIKIVIT